ncbi:hypothetical protein [Pseudorhodoferax sp.]|uniref:hypothetical protein n=1 Tax=Pseudorhodoferax sp. TaxID=1993553 RepID=UPI002DD67F77|nr:hypothetical protein [Pseudorhodoferax sp.]
MDGFVGSGSGILNRFAAGQTRQGRGRRAPDGNDRSRRAASECLASPSEALLRQKLVEAVEAKQLKEFNGFHPGLSL